MIDLGVLDNVIGVVVVILLLSMVVQSIQTFVKKLSNFKTRQIRKSLENLFERAAASAPPQGAATAESVLAHFKDLGRVSAMNRNALESISKVDLTKVVATIEGTSLLSPKWKDSLASMIGTVQEVQAAITALLNTPLPPEAVATLSQLRTQIAPLTEQAARVVDAQGKLKVELIINDVLQFRDFPSGNVVKLATELQGTLVGVAAAAPVAQTLADATAKIHAHVADLAARMRERFDSIATWYDPIMQGFEERYARHMRTWAFIISVIVTVMVDANLPRLYKRMATDEVSKQRVLAEAETIQQRYVAQIAQARDQNNQPLLRELTSRLNDELDEATASYPALGLELIDFDAFWNRTSALEKTKIILGWTLMAFLLSLGAPFWHDALQSLFGLKNFLRGKTETQTVEQATGAGATES